MSSNSNTPSTRNEAPLYSSFWDIFLPLLIVVFPSAIFRLLGWVIQRQNNLGNALPLTMLFAMVVLQTLGIVIMAIIVLARYEWTFQKLMRLTHGHPSWWRRLALFFSIICLLGFDMITNVSIAFAGGDPLLEVSLPLFLSYLVLRLAAFTGLPSYPESLPFP